MKHVHMLLRLLRHRSHRCLQVWFLTSIPASIVQSSKRFLPSSRSIPKGSHLTPNSQSSLSCAKRPSAKRVKWSGQLVKHLPLAHCCLKVQVCALLVKTRVVEHSVSVTLHSSTTKMSGTGFLLLNFRPTKPISGCTTRCCRNTAHSVSSTGTHMPTTTHLLLGKHSLATSSTVLKS